MNNKKNTYLLVAAFIGIWAVVGYQMFANFKEANDVVFNDTSKPDLVEEVKIDSFSILANYSDPFKISKAKKYTPSIPSSKLIKPKKKASTKPEKNNKPAKVDVSHIKYYGTITNSKTGKKVGILYINDEEFLISNNSKIANGSVLKITDDKVSILYKEKSFEIKK